MGFFSNFGRHVAHRSARRRRIEGDAPIAYHKQGKWYKLVSTFAILGLFLDVGLLTLGLTGTFKFSFGFTITLAIIGILCMGLVLSLTWIRYLEQKQYKTLSIAMISIIGFAALLWVAIAIVIYAMYKTENVSIAAVNFIRIGLIISFQVVEAILISSTWARYRKNYILFQAIMYVSNLFVDFYFSILFAGIGFKPFGLNTGVYKMVASRAMITMLVLFSVYTIVSNAVLRSIEERRTRQVKYDLSRAADQQYEEQINAQEEAPSVETPEDKLAKLKELFDKKLITEEEYNTKRAKILEEM